VSAIPVYGAVIISTKAEGGSAVHEQWSVLWPEVSPVGEVVAWVRNPCADEADAWERVADAANSGVVLRVEMRRVTTDVDAWFSPQPPEGVTNGPR
jgi:hypothetical protein